MTADESYAGSRSFHDFETHGARPDRVPARHPHASGTGRREDPVPDHRPGADRLSRTTVTSTPPAPTSSTTGRRRSTSWWRKRRHHLHISVQGEHRSRPARGPVSSGEGAHSGRHADPHQQHGGGPAGQSRERPGLRRDLAPPRHTVHPGRVPIRGERVLHQEARAGPGTATRSRRSRARSSVWRTDAPSAARRTGSRTWAASSRSTTTVSRTKRTTS